MKHVESGIDELQELIDKYDTVDLDEITEDLLGGLQILLNNQSSILELLKKLKEKKGLLSNETIEHYGNRKFDEGIKTTKEACKKIVGLICTCSPEYAVANGGHDTLRCVLIRDLIETVEVKE